MRRSTVVLSFAMGIVAASAVAQQANQNINVLPVYYNETNDPTLPLDPEAHLKGDLYLQRQLEPTIAVSTRNPDHLIAFFNDYRAVDIPGDLGVGEKDTGAPTYGLVRTLLAKIFGISKGAAATATKGSEQPPRAAALEAWAGGSRSYDGGLTWSGFFVPGGPFDSSPASMASPAFGLEAATDPVAASAPCGVVYVGWLAFTRGGSSKMLVSRYQDLNNLPGGDTWVYQDTAVVETGNNAVNGFFLDKPFLLVDPVREGASEPCEHNIYLSYTTFNGLQRDGKFKSKVTFARSTGGLAPESFDTSFDVQKLNAPFQQNQGTWISVDPRPGTPETTGGGAIHLFWRHFFDPEAILTIDSTDYGATFQGNPKKVTGNQDLEAFDQLGISSQALLDAGFDPLVVPSLVSFRSNGFPTSAIAADGTIFVAWQELVDTDPDSPDFGLPSSDGSPRIVLMRSTNGGSSWTDAYGNSNQRRAVDLVVRDPVGDPSTPGPGFGALPAERVSSHQVMPALSCGGGRCLLAYYESRGFFAATIGGGEIVLDSEVPLTGSINGIDRVIDLRAALLDPSSGQLLSTSQVSRYTIAPGADLTDGESVADILPSLSPCSPDDSDSLPLCNRSVNEANKLTSVAGTTPFMGDYNFVIPIQILVLDDVEGWRWAIDATDVPYQSFRAIWADNRNLIPPTQLPGQPEWERYQNYETIQLVDPDGPGGEDPRIEGCPVNWGAKNTDVLTARVDAEIILSAPTTFKIPGAVEVAFPVEITNGTGEEVVYFVTFAPGTFGASFTQSSVIEEIDPGSGPVTNGFLPVFPYSTATVIAHVDAGLTDPVTLQVFSAAEVGGEYVASADLLGSISLNSDGTIASAPVDNESFDVVVSNPLASNPLASNPLASNPLASNPLASNPLASNPLASNPLASNYTLTDLVTWEVTSGGGTTDHSSALALLNVDNSSLYESEDYLFQVVTYTSSSSGGLNLWLGECDPIQVPQAQIISNLVTPPGDVSLITNPLASNPLASNPLASNPLASNPLASNSTLTVAPSDAGSGAAALRTVSNRGMSQSMGHSSPDGTLKAPRIPEKVFVTLLAYKRCTAGPGVFVPCEFEDLFNPLTDPPSLTLLGLSCNEPFVSVEESCDFESPAPDLILATDVADLRDGQPLMVGAGDSFDFPVGAWTVENAGAGDAAPENGPLTHAVYLADAPEIFLENGLLDESVTLIGPIGSVLHLPQFVPEVSEEVFASGAMATFGTPTPLSATIPAGTMPGSYHLVLWIDDGQEISEFNEANNAVSVPIEVVVPNTPPTPVSEGNSYTINEDEILDDVFVAATDDEGDDLTYSISSPASNGTVEIVDAGTGEFQYTPDLNYNGGDSFDFIANDGEFDSSPATVSITIDAVNDPPVATAGQMFSGNEDNPVSGQLQASDVEDAILNFEIVSLPPNGTLVLNPNGSFLYTPNPNFNGTDSFVFRVCEAGSSPPVCSEQSATVSVAVTSVEDVPVALAGLLSTSEDTAVGGVLVATDGDGDPLTYSIVSPASNGSVVGSPLPGFTYTPNLNFSGGDSFTFKANDGKADSNVATVSITVSPTNDAPVAVLDNYGTPEDQTLVVNAPGVLGNDSDPESDPLTAVLVAPPSGGSFGGLDADGSFTFTPPLNAAGQFSFTYRASDSALPSNVVTVTITVAPVNDPPVAVDDPDYVRSGGASLIVAPPGLLANDTDVDGDQLSAALLTGPGNGSVVVDSDGGFTYTPAIGFFGSDSFDYQASDGNGGVDDATATVGVPYQFIGLLDPWKPPSPNPYTIKLGSAFPVRWQYASPATGEVIESSGADPIVRVLGPVNCNTGGDGTEPVEIFSPGNSTYQYDLQIDVHQLNVDSDNLLANKCYDAYVDSGATGQSDGPFVFKVKR